MSKDVFISYSRQDYLDENKNVIPGNIVSRIKELFDNNNISYWIDETGVHSGDQFGSIITKGIRESKIFLFISTESSNASVWTSNEIAVAHHYKKKIIPFRYDKSPYNDAVIIYIASLDFIDYPANTEKAMTRLLFAVKNALKEINDAQEKQRIEKERALQQEQEERARREQIAELTEKINELVTKRDEVSDELIILESNVAIKKSEINNLDLQITTLENELDYVKTGVKRKAEQPKRETNNSNLATTNNTSSKGFKLFSKPLNKHWSFYLLYTIGAVILLLGSSYFKNYGLVFAILIAYYYLIVKDSIIGVYMMVATTLLSIILLFPSVILAKDYYFSINCKTTFVQSLILSIIYAIAPLFIRKNGVSSLSTYNKSITLLPIRQHIGSIIYLIIIALAIIYNIDHAIMDYNLIFSF